MHTSAETLTDAALQARDSYENAKKRVIESDTDTGNTSDLIRRELESTNFAEAQEQKD